MDAALKAHCDKLVGQWSLLLTHRMLPGVEITGSETFEWFGDDFLLRRSHFEHPDFPDALALTGDYEEHYFDVRGVHRLFALTLTADGWTVERGSDGRFAQRLTGTHVGPGQIRVTGQLCFDDKGEWEDDVTIVGTRT